MDAENRKRLVDLRVDLLEKLESVKGKRIQIHQSMSVLRGHWGAHDRHFAATLQYQMRVRFVGWQMSGGHCILDGEDGWLQLVLDRVMEYEIDEKGRFAISEHFEKQTERLTTITILPDDEDDRA